MPGVLQVEFMAQVGGVLVLSTFENPENYLFSHPKSEEFYASGLSDSITHRDAKDL